MAKFAMLYLNDGVHEGKQLVPARGVHDSLQTYSERVDTAGVRSGKSGRHFRDIGYGYQWWFARSGDHHFNYAAGHGGQLIVLLHGLDMVIVTTADPFFGQDRHFESWKHEQAIIDMVGEFIGPLPKG